MKDLLSSFEFVRSEMESQTTLEEVRPTLVAILGEVAFRGLVFLCLLLLF